jgi:hypothetical protein
MTDPLQLRLGPRTLVLVPSSDVEVWSRETAELRLREFAAHWPGRDALLRLSSALFGPDDDIDRAITFIADAMERRELLAVRLPREGGRPIAGGVFDQQWEDIPMLSDLRTPPPWSGGVDAPRRPPPPGAILDPVAPPPPPPRPPEDPSTPHFVGFTVVDQDGAPLRGTYRFEIDGAATEGELGEVPVRREPVPLDAAASVTLEPTGYHARTRPAPAGGEATGDHHVDVAASLGPVPLAIDRTSRIVVRVPKATVFTVPAYALDLEVFRPGWLWFDDAAGEGYSGLGCVAGALAYAREHPERYVLVVGHTDTSGTKSHNREVAERRAAHLAALLRADVEAWVASCVAFAELADLCAHIQWAARRFGWPCDTAIVAKSTPEQRQALAQWRHQASVVTGIVVDPDAPTGADDWRVAYALFDLALAEELDLDLAALASLRAGLRWSTPAIVGAGELWPREMVGVNGVTSAVNRRTEIMFATVSEIPGGAGDPPGSALFGDDAWLWLDYIDPEPRTALPLSLRSKEGYPVPSTPFRLVSDAGRVRFGWLGPGGDTVVDDVAVGGFRVHWIDADDVTTKIWASRCDAALAAGEVAPLRALLGHPPALVQAVARVYGERFAGGDPDALARSVRALVDGTDDAIDVDLLLFEAGFAGEREYDLVVSGDAWLGTPGPAPARGQRGAP